MKNILLFITLVILGYSVSLMPILPGQNIFEFRSENLIIGVIIASIGMILRLGNPKEKI